VAFAAEGAARLNRLDKTRVTLFTDGLLAAAGMNLHRLRELAVSICRDFDLGFTDQLYEIPLCRTAEVAGDFRDCHQFLGIAHTRITIERLDGMLSTRTAIDRISRGHLTRDAVWQLLG
jgi:hypothetical protein